MKCAATIIRAINSHQGLADACKGLADQLGAKPDLAILFLAGQFAEEAGETCKKIRQMLGPRVLIGCTSDSVIGVREELEHEDAVSIWAASWPTSTLQPMHLQLHRSPDGSVITGWPDTFRQKPSADDFMLLLGEPFSFPTDLLLDRMAEDQPDLTIVGGMASRGFTPGMNRLVLNDEEFDHGAIGLLVQSGVKLLPIVSQGCRPIGDPMVITKAERNEVLELGGQPVLHVLETIFRQLPTREQIAMQRGLLVGRVVDEYRDRFGMGDFLIRGVVGIDDDRGSIAVSDYFRPGQTIQFHIRDEVSAHEEMSQLLSRHSNESDPIGGLLFSCNARGSQMFAQEHHDAMCIAERFDDLPLAGFFAAGEIGPVGNRCFMHGFTASLALFAPSSTL